ncbi:MAG: bifunctional hydroxymethylpyrimidine kinase/phosphomethylpyrimidine kinase [Thermoplasmatota archaeon]
MKRPAVLVLGGLDPTGQAGLARDMAAFRSQWLHACPVATGLTVQTSEAFLAPNATPVDVLLAQAEAALTDFDISWAKVGALFCAAQVGAVANLSQEHGLQLVVDPVLAASSGAPFLDGAGVTALRTQLVPQAFLATPNRVEAQALTGESSPQRAAAALVRLGAKAALVKRSGQGADLLFDGRSIHEFPVEKRAGVHRGTGCRLASHTTAFLATGFELVDAVRQAHGELQRELAFDAAQQELTGHRLHHWQELEAWFPRILAEIRPGDVPEVGMNVAYALPGAKDSSGDVLGLAGRITIAGRGRAVAGRLAYGGPHHTGRIAVVLQEFSPTARLVMNHRFDALYLANARRAGMAIASFDRGQEPAGTPSTMEWGVRHAIHSNRGVVPDVVWDAGGPGKEPMMRIIAANPADLVAKLRLLHGNDSGVGEAPMDARLPVA